MVGDLREINKVKSDDKRKKPQIHLNWTKPIHMGNAWKIVRGINTNKLFSNTYATIYGNACSSLFNLENMNEITDECLRVNALKFWVQMLPAI